MHKNVSKVHKKTGDLAPAMKIYVVSRCYISSFKCLNSNACMFPKGRE